MRDLVAQRLYALCCGYEDLNDHTALRNDPLMQTAVGQARELGSSPTLCRLEKRAARSTSSHLSLVTIRLTIGGLLFMAFFRRLVHASSGNSLLPDSCH